MIEPTFAIAIVILAVVTALFIAGLILAVIAGVLAIIERIARLRSLRR